MRFTYLIRIIVRPFSNMVFRCYSCQSEPNKIHAICDQCGGFIQYIEDDTANLHAAVDGDPTAALPEFDANLSMGEGETPFVALEHIDVHPTVYGKLESLNPTCSFKDRGSTLAVSAVSDNNTSWKALIVASTGNTAPSVAAYAARAAIPCAVLMPDGTSLSKLAQVDAHNIDIYTVDGTFSDCFQLAQQVSNEQVLNGTAVYSANPFVASANRTVAFEIVNQLGEAPDWVSIPVGAGPLLGGTHLGFTELYEASIIDTQPRMLCVQARGCHPVVRAIKQDEAVKPWTESITTNIGAIADPLNGYSADGEQTHRAVIESNGDGIALDDKMIHTWVDHLAATEGIYAEPASAASIAAVTSDVIDPDDTVVGLVTGHGLKEPSEREPTSVPFEGDPADLRTLLLS